MIKIPSTNEYRFYELGQKLARLKTIDGMATITDKTVVASITQAMIALEAFVEDPLLPPNCNLAAQQLHEVLDSCWKATQKSWREQEDENLGYRAERVQSALVKFETMLSAIDPLLGAFLQDHPDPSKCGFLMMPFRDEPSHHDIRQCIRQVCKDLELQALRVDDNSPPRAAALFSRIQTLMHGCGFGIAVFERVANEYSNPNVSLEVGYMLALGKPVCLLKEKSVSLPSDLTGSVFSTFDVQRIDETIPPALTKWLRDNRLTR